MLLAYLDEGGVWVHPELQAVLSNLHIQLLCPHPRWHRHIQVDLHASNQGTGAHGARNCVHEQMQQVAQAVPKRPLMPCCHSICCS